MSSHGQAGVRSQEVEGYGRGRRVEKRREEKRG